MTDKCVIAKTDMVYIYGEYNKAFIKVRRQQKWCVTGYPTPDKPYYSLLRNNVAIQVMRDDYYGKFKEVSE